MCFRTPGRWNEWVKNILSKKLDIEILKAICGFYFCWESGAECFSREVASQCSRHLCTLPHCLLYVFQLRCWKQVVNIAITVTIAWRRSRGMISRKKMTQVFFKYISDVSEWHCRIGVRDFCDAGRALCIEIGVPDWETIYRDQNLDSEAGKIKIVGLLEREGFHRDGNSAKMSGSKESDAFWSVFLVILVHRE